MSDLGNKIKMKRLALGYSQDSLAKMVGYKTRSSIAKIESGESDISQTKIYEFARALNCAPSDLLDIHEFTEPDRVALRKAFGTNGVLKSSIAKAKTEVEEYSESEKQLIENYRKLNADGQEIAESHLNYLLSQGKYKKCDSSQELA